MITYYAANKILQALIGKVNSVAFNSAVYVGLSATAPSANGTNVSEPAGNGYARVLLGNTGQTLTQKMADPANGESVNDEIIYFPEATGSWGTLTYFCFFDAQNNGNLLAYGALAQAITPAANTIPIVRVGELTVSLS